MNETTSNREFQEIIAGYEEYVKTLSTQLEVLKQEQDVLKTETKCLIQENNILIDKLAESLKKASGEDYLPGKFSETNFLENMKLQLSLALNEKQSLMELWQDSLKTIDHLEGQLKLYEERSSAITSNKELKMMKSNYEKQIKNLKSQLQQTQEALDDVKNQAETEAEVKDKQCVETKLQQNAAKKAVKKLDEELRQIKIKQTEILKMKSDHAMAIAAKNILIEELHSKESQSKIKISEALQLVEAALMEKDAALTRELEIKGEMEKLTKLLSEVVDETKEKVKYEVELIETKYRIKHQKVAMDLESLREDVRVKNDEIAKYKKDYQILESQFEKISKGNIQIDDSHTSKLLILEKNLESTFQKLLLSEKNNQQLIADRDRVKSDLDQMANFYQQDVQMKEMEKGQLESKIKWLQSELQQGNLKLIQLVARVNELNGTLEQMKEEVKAEFHVKARISQTKLNEQISEIQNSNTAIQSELTKQLEQQIELNKKWKSELYDITDILKKRLIELKTEVVFLKKENKSLKSKLDENETKLSEYKTGFEILCADVNNAIKN